MAVDHVRARLARRPTLVIVLVVVAPLVLVAIVLLWRPWVPVLDMAMTELRIRDVGGANTPLVGLPGRIGTFPDQGSHPGPWSFYAIAPFYRLAGSSAWGMELGVFAGAFGLDRDVEVKWGDVRFVKIAEGYGAHGEFVDRTEDVGPGVERALASGRPAVVQVAVDPTVNAFHVPHLEEFATWYTGGYSA